MITQTAPFVAPRRTPANRRPAADSEGSEPLFLYGSRAWFGCPRRARRCAFPAPRRRLPDCRFGRRHFQPISPKSPSAAPTTKAADVVTFRRGRLFQRRGGSV